MTCRCCKSQNTQACNRRSFSAHQICKQREPTSLFVQKPELLLRPLGLVIDVPDNSHIARCSNWAVHTEHKLPKFQQLSTMPFCERICANSWFCSAFLPKLFVPCIRR